MKKNWTILLMGMVMAIGAEAVAVAADVGALLHVAHQEDREDAVRNVLDVLAQRWELVERCVQQ